jgi:hypothetical protein
LTSGNVRITQNAGMHKRVTVVVSVVLFSLLALMGVLVTDLHDRDFPERVGAKATAYLDFAESGLSDEVAFGELGALSDRYSIGLVKVVPDLRGSRSGEVFVALGTGGPSPRAIPRFGNEPDARVTGPAELTNSYSTGQYLVTGATTSLAQFKAELTDHNVHQEWSEDRISTTLSFLARQASLGTTMLATLALTISLALYWLSVKAKGRALRVLGGVATRRIQYEDLSGFLTVMVVGMIVCDVVAVMYVGFAHGWPFVPYYGRVLVTFDAIVIAITMACAGVMSVASQPSPGMLAARVPAVTGLRTTSVVLKTVTFALVLVAATPAVRALADARESAAEQAQWKSLADQAAMSFRAGTGEVGFQEVMPKVGQAVRDAERDGLVALSYTWNEDVAGEGVLGSYAALSLVNQRWLDLMLKGGHDGTRLVAMSPGDLPESVRALIGPQLELSSPNRVTAIDALNRVSFFQYSGRPGIPVSLAGSGELIFPRNAIVAVVPNLYATLDDDFLISTASTKNLVFSGLAQTQALITKYGLGKQVDVKFVAEEGIRRAELTAYFAWLRGASLAALVVALAVSTFVGALIEALLKARRDFPLRLAGKRWPDILGDRLRGELVIGGVLIVLVMMVQRWQSITLVGAFGIAGLLGSAWAHAAAARWTFVNVSLRKL